MGVLEQLKSLSSAEDFFVRLGVPYDRQVLDVARLHILKRMGQYLARETFPDRSDAEIEAACRDTLARAYADFERSSPLAERVFKVLKERDPQAPASKTAFVPFSALFESVERT
ncbi:nitrogenase stabilizing/protective protein NifW [Aquabacter cavernae]|uniref:nitrogenase stabilizing/protective protein NifW n=1 Tax=Aquabacter cavernae TaxID=2496029 RepID=UPI000F8CA62E|nr:nitrogenase stabilizing/protective protein NifW [Aquabacter cavernae]